MLTDGNATVHKMELEKLQSALQTLSSNEQMLIELYYYKDWSMEQIEHTLESVKWLYLNGIIVSSKV